MFHLADEANTYFHADKTSYNWCCAGAQKSTSFSRVRTLLGLGNLRGDSDCKYLALDLSKVRCPDNWLGKIIWGRAEQK